MLSVKNRAGAIASVLMALACMAVAFPHAKAQETPAENRQFSAQTGELVLAAQNHITGEEYQAALGKLTEALNVPSISAYEQAMIYRMQGSSYYQLEQMALAISALEKALASGGLTGTEAAALRPQIAQIMIANGRHFSQWRGRMKMLLT